MKRLFALILIASSSALAQSTHNGNLSVLGTFDVSVAPWSKPMPTVSADPSGPCSNAAAMVLNTSTGLQMGHISGCIGGSWRVLNDSSSVTLTGDVSGSANSSGSVNATVTKINGVPLNTLSGIARWSSGFPSNASYSDIVSMFAGGACNGYINSNGTCGAPTPATIWLNNTGTAIGPSLTTPSASDTLKVYDSTATTGSTILRLQAGAGQGSNNILEVDDNGGTAKSSIGWASGYPYWYTLAPTNLTNYGTFGLGATGDTFNRLKIGLDSGKPFIEMGTGSANFDVGIERASTNTIQVVNGGLGFKGNLIVGNLQMDSCTGAGCAGAQFPLARTTANYTPAVARDSTVLADATSASLTVTLPASPLNGDRVRVKRVDTVSANTVSVVANTGQSIEASVSTSVTPHEALGFMFESATSTWWSF